MDASQLARSGASDPLDPQLERMYAAQAHDAAAEVVPAVTAVPLRTLVRCPGCAAAVEILLIVDDTLLPGIPVRAAELPTACVNTHVTFAAEDRAEIERGVDAIIARVGQYLLYTPPPRRLPRLTLASVRRTITQILPAEQLTFPAKPGIRSREEDH